MRNQKGQFVKGYHPYPNTEFKKGQHWRKPNLHWEKDWLYQKYIIEGLSYKEIAKIQGCTENNIYYWAKKHNIKARTMTEIRQKKYWGLKGKENGMFNKNGRENPNWKGGITPERQLLYSSLKWKQIRKEVFRKDNFKCKRCKVVHTQGNKLHIHHIIGFENKSTRMDINYLILLCHNCHSWVHSKRNIEKEYLDENIVITSK